MLILNRNSGEKIKIGKEVTITVISSSDNQVRIGIDAPRDIDVHREEIYHRINNSTDGASVGVVKDSRHKKDPSASRESAPVNYGAVDSSSSVVHEIPYPLQAFELEKQGTKTTITVKKRRKYEAPV